MGVEVLQFGLEGRIGLGLIPLFLEVEDQRHQGFGNEAAAENTEAAVFIRPGLEGIQFWRLVHFILPATAFFSQDRLRQPYGIEKRVHARQILDTWGTFDARGHIDGRRPGIASASATLSLFKPPESM